VTIARTRFHDEQPTTTFAFCRAGFTQDGAGASVHWGEARPREAIQVEGQDVHPAETFVATVLDGAPNLCTAGEGPQTVALIQSAYRSAVGGGS